MENILCLSFGNDGDSRPQRSAELVAHYRGGSGGLCQCVAVATGGRGGGTLMATSGAGRGGSDGRRGAREKKIGSGWVGSKGCSFCSNLKY